MGGCLSIGRNQGNDNQQGHDHGQGHAEAPQLDLNQVFPDNFDQGAQDLNWAQQTSQGLRTHAGVEDLDHRFRHVMGRLELGQGDEVDTYTGYGACHQSSSVTATMLDRYNLTPQGAHSSTQHTRHGGVYTGIDHAFQVLTENPVNQYAERSELIQNDQAVIVDGAWKQFFEGAGQELLEQAPDVFIGTRTQLSELGGQLGFEGDDLQEAMKWWGNSGQLDSSELLSPVQDTLGLALGEADNL